MRLHVAAISVLVLVCGIGTGCRAKTEPVTDPPVVKKLGAPPEDLTDAQKEELRLQIEARELERANRPPPEIKIEWPPALETDLAVFNGWWIRLEARVDFEPENQEVTPEAMDVLDDVAFILQDTPRIRKVEIQSHRRSDIEPYGRNITQLRANAVKVYLVGQGIDAERVEAKGYGETMPIESNVTEFGRRANDRVEIIVRQIDEHIVNAGQ